MAYFGFQKFKILITNILRKTKFRIC